MEDRFYGWAPGLKMMFTGTWGRGEGEDADEDEDEEEALAI